MSVPRDAEPGKFGRPRLRCGLLRSILTITPVSRLRMKYSWQLRLRLCKMCQIRRSDSGSGSSSGFGSGSGSGSGSTSLPTPCLRHLCGGVKRSSLSKSNQEKVFRRREADLPSCRLCCRPSTAALCPVVCPALCKIDAAAPGHRRRPSVSTATAGLRAPHRRRRCRRG